MPSRRTVALIVVALAAIPLATADEPCYTTSEPEWDSEYDSGVSVSGEGTGRYYRDDDYVQGCWAPWPCGLFSWWLYEESNGIDGLQRHDEVRSDVSGCTDGTRGDTVVW